MAIFIKSGINNKILKLPNLDFDMAGMRFFGYCKNIENINLSYDVASGSEITPCNKIYKPLVVYRFTGNIMTSITTLRT